MHFKALGVALADLSWVEKKVVAGEFFSDGCKESFKTSMIYVNFAF